jgi:Tat protein secretion system quality control protein TatD with DNase activity
MEALNSLSMRICAMASRRTDQSRVAEIARSHPDKVTPAFGEAHSVSITTLLPIDELDLGYHPWFSHLISLQRVPDTPEDKDMHYRTLFLPEGSKNSKNETHVQAFNRVLPGLPSPFALEDLISVIRDYLAEFVSTHKADPVGHRKPMLGEVGLDRSFRVPFSAYQESETPAEDDGPRLTPFFVPIEHQLAILEAQVDLAVEFGINVSLHSVQAQAHTVSFFKHMLEKHGPRFDAISVDMHSCGVSTATWKDIEVRVPLSGL